MRSIQYKPKGSAITTLHLRLEPYNRRGGFQAAESGGWAQSGYTFCSRHRKQVRVGILMPFRLVQHRLPEQPCYAQLADSPG